MEMDKLCTWFKVIKLPLNVKKTICIIFNSRHSEFDGQSNCSTNLFIGNCLIIRVKFSKFLGMIIEENLFWKEHINVILNKISKSLGVLYRMKMPYLYLFMYYVFII